MVENEEELEEEEEGEGVINTLVKAGTSMIDSMAKGASRIFGTGNLNIQVLKIPVPTQVIMKYIPSMIEDIKTFKIENKEHKERLNERKHDQSRDIAKKKEEIAKMKADFKEKTKDLKGGK